MWPHQQQHGRVTRVTPPWEQQQQQHAQQHSQRQRHRLTEQQGRTYDGRGELAEQKKTASYQRYDRMAPGTLTAEIFRSQPSHALSEEAQAWLERQESLELPQPVVETPPSPPRQHQPPPQVVSLWRQGEVMAMQAYSNQEPVPATVPLPGRVLVPPASPAFRPSSSVVPPALQTNQRQMNWISGRQPPKEFITQRQDDDGVWYPVSVTETGSPYPFTEYQRQGALDW